MTYSAGVWFAYVDESFNAKQHWVVALLIQHEQVNATARALRDLVEEASDEYGINPFSELHGYDLFHGKEQFEPLDTMPRARIGLYSAAFQTLVDANCWVILRGVSKPGLVRRYGLGHDHPHRVGMTHLIERIDEFCESAHGGGDHAVIVADEHHETQSILLRDLVVFQDQGTWGYRRRRIRRVVDTIHFVNSRTNPLVQGADLVAFLALRAKTVRERDPRAARATEAIQEIIAPRVHHDHCWWP
jgi:hypothetical protein